MKKFLSLFILVCVFLAPYPSRATDLDPEPDANFALGLYGLGVFPNKDNLDMDGGGGLYGRLLLLNPVSLELAVEFARHDFTSTVDNTTGTVSGTLSVIPLLLTGRYHLPELYGFHPTFGVGVNYLIVRGSASGTLSPGGAARVNFGNAFGGHVTAGFNRQLVGNLYFDLESRYIFAESSTSETVAVGVIAYDNMDLSQATLHGALEWRF